MLKYIFLLFPFLIFGQSRTFESYGGVGNGTTDNVAAFNAMVADASNVTEVTFSGTYYFSVPVNLNNIEGLTLRGSGQTRATFRVTNQNAIINVTQTNVYDVKFINLKFESTHTSTGQGNPNALVRFSDHVGENIVFKNCEFTAPTAVTNGIKFYCNDAARYRNIYIEDCLFENLGRMGVETVNHVAGNLDVARFESVTVKNSTFRNTGLVQYGMGVSLSGRNDYVYIVGNTFENNPSTAIELIGVKNAKIFNNTTTGTGSPWHTVRLNVAGDTQPNDGVLLENNQFNSNRGAVIIGARNVVSRNNDYTSDSNFFAQNYQNISFINDEFVVRGYNPTFNGGTPTAFIQKFAPNTNYPSDVTPNSNISFTNCRIELTNNVPFFQNQDGITPTVSCSNVYHPNSASQYSANSSDVNVYVNNVFSSEVGDTGASCGTVGRLPQTTHNFDSFLGLTFEQKWSTMKSVVVANDVVQFNSGTTYNLSQVASLNDLDFITLTSTSTAKPIIVAPAANNLNGIWTATNDVQGLRVDNISFRNDDSSISHPPGAGLLRFSDGNFNDIKVNNCYFTAVGQTNGMKTYVTNQIRHFMRNLEITNNTFENLGQMGFEVVNHRNDAFPGNERDGYDNILIENNTITNVGTIQYGMGISLSGEGTNVLVRNNSFTDCPTTAIEFIGTDESTIIDNTFAGNTKPYNLVRGSGRINNMVNLTNNSGTVTQGSVFINATNVTITNDNVNFGSGFFMQGIKNILIRNTQYKGSGSYVISFRAATSAEQEVHSNNGTDGLKIIQSNIESTTSNPALDIQGTHHAMSVDVECSDIRVGSGSNYAGLVSNASINYLNSERFSNGVSTGIQNPSGASCSNIGYVPLALPITPGTQPTIPLSDGADNASCNINGATYYVSTTGSDSNDGSIGSPFASWSAAYSAATAGDTIIFRAGTYSNFGEMAIAHTGFAVEAYPDETVIINNGYFQLWGTCISIKNIELTNIYGQFTAAVKMGAGVQNVTLDGLKIHDFGYSQSPSGPATSSDNANAIIAFCDSALSGNFVVRNCEVYNGTLGYSEAISFAGDIDGVLVENTTVRDVDNIGIDAVGGFNYVTYQGGIDAVRNFIFRNNTVYNCISPYATSAGLYSDGSYNGLIENNISYNNGYGIEIGSEEAPANGRNITARNNLIYNNTHAGITVGGYNYPTTGKNTNILVEHNTLYNNDTSNSGLDEFNQSYVEGLTVRANLIVSGDTDWYNVQNANATGVVNQNNIISTVPLDHFISISNFNLIETSSAIDAVSPSSVFTTDLLGNTRQGNYDAGAYEFIGSTNRNAAFYKYFFDN